MAELLLSATRRRKLDSYRTLEQDRGLRRSPSRLRPGHTVREAANRGSGYHRAPALRDATAGSGLAVTQVCLHRDDIILVARLSASTRLSSNRCVPRIVILRLLLREALAAAIEPETVLSAGALTAGLRAHFETLRDRPGHQLTQLAMNLRSWQEKAIRPEWSGNRDASARNGRGSTIVRQPTTLRMPTVEIVALDNYRNDIREASGVCISRSAILRATIESFSRAFQV